MYFKHADTALLVVSLAAFLLLTVGATWLFGSTVGFIVGLTLALGLIVGVNLNLYRKREADDTKHQRHMQALLALQAMLDLRAPLPPLTGWAASPELVATLVDLVRRHRPRVIVELGSGASTVAMAYALEQVAGTPTADEATKGGRLHSLDHEKVYGAATQAQLARHGLADYARVHHAPLRDVTFDGRSFSWYDLDALPDGFEIDMLVIDGPPRETNAHARFPALPALIDRLAPDAFVVLDDADRDDEAAAIERWRELYDGFRVERYPSPKGTAVLHRSG